MPGVLVSRLVPAEVDRLTTDDDISRTGVGETDDVDPARSLVRKSQHPLRRKLRAVSRSGIAVRSLSLADLENVPRV